MPGCILHGCPSGVGLEFVRRGGITVVQRCQSYMRLHVCHRMDMLVLLNMCVIFGHRFTVKLVFNHCHVVKHISVCVCK